MSLIEWTSKLSVGVDLIDAQHQEIFKRINALVEAMKGGQGQAMVPGLLDFLEDYVKEHFAEEEELMLKNLYPGFEPHKGEHAEFVRDIARLRAQFTTEGATPAFTVAFNNRVCVWIISHIMRSDLAMATYLSKRKAQLGSR